MKSIILAAVVVASLAGCAADPRSQRILSGAAVGGLIGNEVDKNAQQRQYQQQPYRQPQYYQPHYGPRSYETDPYGRRYYGPRY